jgi:hypothetical protein
LNPEVLLRDLVPYEGQLRYADDMVAKVKTFIVSELGRASS